MKILSIIPAKEKSRGLPGKNIKQLNGHPLLSYSIEASLLSNFVQRTICSTDSELIAGIAKNYGAEVPFLRPKELCKDHTTDLQVFEHLIEWLKEHENYIPDIIVHLRPTTPVRKQTWIDEAVDILIADKTADSVRTVCEAPIHPCKMWKKDEGNYLKPLLEVNGINEPYNMPRQLLPKYYWQSATIDVIRRETITKQKSMTGKNILPLFIPMDLAVDIDNMRDFILAQAVINDESEIVRPKGDI